MNFKVIHGFLICAIWFLLGTSISAQENASVQRIKVLKNDTAQVLINSNPYSQPFGYPDGYISGFTKTNTGNSGDAIYQYVAPIGFTGVQEFVVEYRGAGTPGSWPPLYSTLIFEVQPSIINAAKDVINYTAGTTSVEIFPLANDNTTSTNLNLLDLAQVSGGTAIVTANNSIIFTPTVNTDFTAFIEYIVEDDAGTAALGSISIQSDDVAVMDSLSFSITNDRAFHILLPTPNCVVASGGEALFGLVEINGADLSYMPDAASVGADEITLEDGGATLHIALNVVDPPNQVGAVRDDYLFTTVNTPTSSTTLNFDVFENDLTSIGVFVVDHSPELTHISGGDFSFTPTIYTTGVYEFFYTIYNGFEHQTANIFLSVENHIPDNITAHDLAGIKNTPLILEHHIPINAHSFELISAPNNGTINIGTGPDTLQIDCNEITGNKMIIYTPNNNFTGVDNFELEYKINGQTGPIVKVDLEIYEDTQSALCHCIGPDCVWTGDTNHDGEVYVDDLLPIGFMMGNTGPARNDISYSQWQGQHGTDWGTGLGASKLDLKYIDSDGDGRITSKDADAIAANYDKVHNFVSDPFVGNKEYGLFFVPHQSVVDSGDMACLDILLSNGPDPLVDIHGLSLGINIEPEIVDSASWTIDFMEDSWLTYNASHMHMEVIPQDGRMDVAITRSDAQSSTGAGKIATTCFIVEDDVNGFRGDQKAMAEFIPITTSRAKSMDSKGNTFYIENAKILLPTVQAEDKEKPRPQVREDIIVYPNPTQGILNIHLNGPRDIEDIVVHDLYQRVVLDQKDIRSDRWSFDTSNLAAGLYILNIRTSEGWHAQRFEVFRSR